MQFIKNKRNLIIWSCIFCLIAIYIIIFTHISLCKYFNFLYGDWDLAIYNQIFRGLIQGKPYTSLADVPFLGIHADITATLITPLYLFFPYPITLLIIQSIMLGLGAIPLFLIVKKELGEAWGLIFVVAYLLYPAVGYINLNEFHTESFLPFIHFFLFYAFIKKDFKKFSIWVLACLFAKENMSLILITMGIYAWIDKRGKKWILLPMLSGIIWLTLYGKVIFPAVNQQKVEFLSIYNNLGDTPPEILWTIIAHPIKTLGFIIHKMGIFKTYSSFGATPPQTPWAIIFHPIKTLGFIFQQHKLNYIIYIFGPLSFLSFLKPSILLIPLPNFLQHLLSLRLTETFPTFYYPAESLAFVFIAAIYGIKRLLKIKFLSRHKNVFYVTMPAIAIFFNIMVGPQVYMLLQMKGACRKSETVMAKDRFIGIIPKQAAVVSTFEFLPKLSNLTDRLYSFHRILSGTYHTNMKFSLPENVDYALIDFNDPLTFGSFFIPGASDSNLINFFREGRWKAIEACENIVLFRKDHSRGSILYEPASSVPISTAGAVDFGKEIRLVNWKIENSFLKKGEKLAITFYWAAKKDLQNDYWLFICLFNPKSSAVYKIATHPFCYRIHPTYMWKENETIKEEYGLLIPISGIPEGTYTLAIGVFDFWLRKFSDIRTEGTRQKVGDCCITLAEIQVN